MSSAAAVLSGSFLLGAVGAAILWRLLAHAFDSPLFLRTNVRGADVPVAVGMIIPLVLVGAAAGFVLAESASWTDTPLTALSVTVFGALGFAFLGLLDDLAGNRDAQGFGGHLRALRSSQLTTGAVKLFGGAAVAMLIAAPTSAGRPGILLADAALIALAANLANLLDRAPGRLGKAALVAAVPIVVVAGADQRLIGPAIVIGALAALLVHDLRERLMLGDTGANVVGGILGLAAVMTTAPSTRVAMLAVVAALNLASERVSFSRVIERVAVLRWLDGFGRLPADP